MSGARLAPLLVLGCLALAGCKTELNRGLTESEANEITAVLMQQGIPVARTSDPKDHTVTVTVEEARFADAVSALRTRGLPRPHYAAVTDVFKGDGLVSSPVEERERLVYAMGENLGSTIALIDGVLDARVHIVLPDNDPLRRDVQPSSASVFIRYAQGAKLDALVPQIKMLVANGVAGLSYDKVSVVMVPAAASAAASPEAIPAFVSLAGISVAPDSLQVLQAVLAGGAFAIVSLLGLVIWLATRSRPSADARMTNVVVR